MALPINPVVLIPARLASTRLPNKPLADIHGEPMIVHVWRRAMEAEIGRVVVAAAEADIADAIIAVGGEAVLTRPDHASGSDRIFEALSTIDPGREHDAIVNIQGDLPTVEAAAIRAAFAPLANPDVDIATIAAEITEPAERTNPNVVKAVAGFTSGGGDGAAHPIARALYFTRASAPSGDGPLYHHIGLYAYRRAALERFVEIAPSPLEQREKLEQLRALEAGMRIDVALVDTVPLGVDTPVELARARKMLAPD
ncbi:MAG: 3-deoxy-manno-octulosonate cytidylyltransferase [Rhodospirillaceae bacterium]|jgi:3-deoxy-manno-octulosonate cytidylyltransferase (CMP-KDO synthetase)|nr:3-deoxy-manno-octulosonate cytidylyltransferase [Rhodospirillaceae bacterium]